MSRCKFADWPHRSNSSIEYGKLEVFALSECMTPKLNLSKLEISLCVQNLAELAILNLDGFMQPIPND